MACRTHSTSSHCKENTDFWGIWPDMEGRIWYTGDWFQKLCTELTSLDPSQVKYANWGSGKMKGHSALLHSLFTQAILKSLREYISKEKSSIFEVASKGKRVDTVQNLEFDAFTVQMVWIGKIDLAGMHQVASNIFRTYFCAMWYWAKLLLFKSVISPQWLEHNGTATKLMQSQS